MATSLVETLADAVTEELNGPAVQALVSPELFVAIRQFMPRIDRARMLDLQVLVSPVTRRDTLENRGGLQLVECSVSIGLYKGIASDGEQELGPLLKLTEDLSNYFLLFRVPINRRQFTCYGTQWGNEDTPLFGKDLVENLLQFGTLIRLDFRGVA